MRTTILIRCSLLLAVLAVVPCLSAAKAQSLVEMYRSARFRTQAEHVLTEHGRRATPLPVAHVPYATDSVRQQIDGVFRPEVPSPAPKTSPAFQIRKADLIPKLGRGWFERTFEHVDWSYLGSNEISGTDTTFTRDLRAMMEAHFGSPTETIADHGGEDEPLEYIQFEYWFVLNDSIPLVIMDVNGPFERGVVVATDEKHRQLLPDMKDVLLGPMLSSGERAPYVDYYYLEEQQMWFLTGFDGERFFLERITRPNLRMGRPLLQTVLER